MLRMYLLYCYESRDGYHVTLFCIESSKNWWQENKSFEDVCTFNMSVSLKKKCAIKIIDKSLVFHLWMPRYKNLKEDGNEANDIHIFRSCIVLSRCACKVPNSRHKSFSWNKVHVNISSPSPLLTKVWIAETNYYRTNDHMTY